MILNKISEDCQTKETSEKTDVMKQNFELSKWICKCNMLLWNAPNITFILKTIRSYTYDAVEDRELLSPLSFPDFMDEHQSPYYEIVFFTQLVTTLFCVNTHALIDGLLATFVITQVINVY